MALRPQLSSAVAVSRPPRFEALERQERRGLEAWRGFSRFPSRDVRLHIMCKVVAASPARRRPRASFMSVGSRKFLQRRLRLPTPLLRTNASVHCGAVSTAPTWPGASTCSSRRRSCCNCARSERDSAGAPSAALGKGRIVERGNHPRALGAERTLRADVPTISEPHRLGRGELDHLSTGAPAQVSSLVLAPAAAREGILWHRFHIPSCSDDATIPPQLAAGAGQPGPHCPLFNASFWNRFQSDQPPCSKTFKVRSTAARCAK